MAFSLFIFHIFSLFSILIFLGFIIYKIPLIFFFTRKSFVKYFLLKFTKEFPLNWSRTSSRKFYKRIPFNFDLGSFYKEIPWKFFFTWKSFVKLFLLNFIKEFPFKLIWDLQQKILQKNSL